jgi:excisionase family DNA binding protein
MGTCNKSTSGVYSLINHLEEFRRLMSVEDVAAVLDVSKFTVYRMAQNKQIPSFIVGGQRRFDPAALAMHFRKKSPESAAAARQLQESIA